MNNNLLNVIKQITAKYGESVLSEPRRVSAFFADLAREEPKPQKTALVKCLEHNFAQTFKNVSENERGSCKQKLAQRLHDEEGLDFALCEETLELLAAVLFGEQKEQKNMCKNCGKELQEGWKACPFCGAAVESPSIGSAISSGSGGAGYGVSLIEPAIIIPSDLRLIRTLEGHKNTVTSVAFSPDGKYIISGGGHFDGTVKLWETESGHLVRTFEGQYKADYSVLSVTFIQDNIYVVSCHKSAWLDHGILELFEAKSGRHIHTLKGHKEEIISAAFSPDGKYIVSASSDETLKLWETESGQLIRTLEERREEYGKISHGIISVAFDPDGKYIVSGSKYGQLKLWEVESGRWLSTSERFVYNMESVAFSPDGEYIISGLTNGNLKLWERAGERWLHPVRTFEGHKEPVSAVAFSPDGKYIVSGSADKTIKLWDYKGAP